MTSPRILTLLLLLWCLAFTTAIQSQSIEERLTAKRPDCTDMFANAVQLLPAYYHQKQFDSIQYVTDFLETRCSQNMETFQLRLLLAIQQKSFDEQQMLDSNALQLLDHYALVASDQKSNARFYSDPSSLYYQFTRGWAEDLLRRSNLAPTPRLVAEVLAGRTRSASNLVKANKEEYAYLYSLLKQQQLAERKQPQGFITLTSGIWVPTGDLATLGVHPQIGMQFGARDQYNQVDLTMNFKFARTANPYTVIRHTIPYTTDYFFGGYIGLDYTRYLLQNTHVDLGLLAGAGYDGFDIVNSDEYYDDYLSPHSIGSFNFNTGIRFNYFVSPGFNIGLIGRYNMVHYKNNGGTSLKGDSFSIDLVLGFNTRRYRTTYQY